VTDFKTSRSSWSEAKALESAEQLILYKHAAGAMAVDRTVPIHIGFGVLTKHKTPRAEMIDVPSTPGQFDRTLESVRQIWSAVEAGNFFANPNPMNCSTCPYKSRCPAYSAS
jgi:CRISPR/Cas system-associated exonuclease Cas4 (RecB family)